MSPLRWTYKGTRRLAKELTVMDVNAGEKMHRRAGAKLHHGSGHQSA